MKEEWLHSTVSIVVRRGRRNNARTACNKNKYIESVNFYSKSRTGVIYSSIYTDLVYSYFSHYYYLPLLLDASEHRSSFLCKRYERLITILRLHYSIIHCIFHLLTRNPPQRLNCRSYSNRTTLADFFGKPHSLIQHQPFRPFSHALLPPRALLDRPIITTITITPRSRRRLHLNQIVRDPQPIRLPSTHSPPREDQLPRSRNADEVRQPERAARARDDAQPRLGQRDGRGRGEHAEVRGEGDLEAAAQGGGGDGGDGGDGEVGEGGEGLAEGG